MKHLALFNGIGGFQLAAQWMGWENTASVEIDPWCNKVTKKHFPDCEQHTDIKLFDGLIYRNRIDIITGGFPCQPFSVAGEQQGTDDNRHLWPEMYRVFREIQPGVIVAENVTGLLSIQGGLVFRQICNDLENEGYEVQPFIFPAYAVGAPHIRDRVWIIAYSKCKLGKISLFSQNNGVTAKRGRNAQVGSENWKLSFMAPRIGSIFEGWGNKPEPHFVNDGFSDRLDTDAISEKDWIANSLKSSGNAIVPQVAYQIFKAIEASIF